MTWIKREPIEGGSKGCLHCGEIHTVFQMDNLIAIGFGSAVVLKNNETVYDEMRVKEDKFWSGQDAENAALEDPDHDWQIHINGPMYSSHYQRQGNEHWILFYKDLGFA